MYAIRSYYAMTFAKVDGGKGLEAAVENICKLAEKAVDDKKAYVILSDKMVDSYNFV